MIPIVYGLIFIWILLMITGIFLYIFSYKLRRLEVKIIHLFRSRTDIFPSLFEASRWSLVKHHEIFKEILELRKKEFSLSHLSNEIEGFFDLESKIHHEINFIFQVCNKNPELIKNGNFLYIRDVIIDKSGEISHEVKKYKKAIEIYNTCIQYKNYTIIWLLLPFYKKTLLT